MAMQALRTGTSIASVILILAAGLIIPNMGFRAPLALFSCVFIGARCPFRSEPSDDKLTEEVYYTHNG